MLSEENRRPLFFFFRARTRQRVKGSLVTNVWLVSVGIYITLLLSCFETISRPPRPFRLAHVHTLPRLAHHTVKPPADGRRVKKKGGGRGEDRGMFSADEIRDRIEIVLWRASHRSDDKARAAVGSALYVLNRYFVPECRQGTHVITLSHERNQHADTNARGTAPAPTEGPCATPPILIVHTIDGATHACVSFRDLCRQVLSIDLKTAFSRIRQVLAAKLFAHLAETLTADLGHINQRHIAILFAKTPCSNFRGIVPFITRWYARTSNWLDLSQEHLHAWFVSAEAQPLRDVLARIWHHIWSRATNMNQLMSSGITYVMLMAACKECGNRALYAPRDPAPTRRETAVAHVDREDAHDVTAPPPFTPTTVSAATIPYAVLSTLPPRAVPPIATDRGAVPPTVIVIDAESATTFTITTTTTTTPSTTTTIPTATTATTVPITATRTTFPTATVAATTSTTTAITTVGAGVAAPRRGRGRPRKDPRDLVQRPRRPRGRPRKHPIDVPPTVAVVGASRDVSAHQEARPQPEQRTAETRATLPAFHSIKVEKTCAEDHDPARMAQAHAIETRSTDRCDSDRGQKRPCDDAKRPAVDSAKKARTEPSVGYAEYLALAERGTSLHAPFAPDAVAGTRAPYSSVGPADAPFVRRASMADESFHASDAPAPRASSPSLDLVPSFGTLPPLPSRVTATAATNGHGVPSMQSHGMSTLKRLLPSPAHMDHTHPVAVHPAHGASIDHYALSGSMAHGTTHLPAHHDTPAPRHQPTAVPTVAPCDRGQTTACRCQYCVPAAHPIQHLPRPACPPAPTLASVPTSALPSARFLGALGRIDARTQHATPPDDGNPFGVRSIDEAVRLIEALERLPRPMIDAILTLGAANASCEKESEPHSDARSAPSLPDQTQGSP